MLWSVVDTGWVALGMMAGSLVSAASGAILSLWKEKRLVAKVNRADAITEWQELSARLESQHERCESVVRQQQIALDAMFVECVELRAGLRSLYGYARSLHDMLAAAGHHPADVPELPVRASPEFLNRQAAQSATLLEEARQVLYPPATPQQGKAP